MTTAISPLDAIRRLHRALYWLGGLLVFNTACVVYDLMAGVWFALPFQFALLVWNGFTFRRSVRRHVGLMLNERDILLAQEAVELIERRLNAPMN